MIIYRAIRLYRDRESEKTRNGREQFYLLARVVKETPVFDKVETRTRCR